MLDLSRLPTSADDFYPTSGAHMTERTQTQSVSAWKSITVVVLMLTLMITGLWYWKTANSTQTAWGPSGPVDVKAMLLEAAPVAMTLSLPAELQAVQQVVLTSEVSGKVADIHFTAGDEVRAGQVLVTLDTAVEEADLRAARARATLARKQLERARGLVPTGALTEETLQQREADVDQVAAELAQLQARIGQKQIAAPFDGVVGLRHVNLGQYLNPGDAATTLTRLDRLFVNFDVAQHQRHAVRVGQTVSVQPDEPASEPLIARVSAIEPQVNRDTRNLRVQALLDNVDGRMQPGMYVAVELALADQTERLRLPASAILTSAYGDTALVARELNAEQVGTAEYVPVQIAERIGDDVIIASGLQAGQAVVTEGQLRVQPGSEIRVVNGVDGADFVGPRVAAAGGE